MRWWAVSRGYLEGSGGKGGVNACNAESDCLIRLSPSCVYASGMCAMVLDKEKKTPNHCAFSNVKGHTCYHSGESQRSNHTTS